MSAGKFALATFLGMLPLTFVYTTWGAVFLSSSVIAWLAGLGVVALFFLLPRWIERYDLFSMRRLFQHEVEDRNDFAET